MTIEEVGVKYGETWDTEQLMADFTVEGFGYGYVVARRRGTDQRGSLGCC